MSNAQGLDLLVVNPGNAAQIYQNLASDLAAYEPPVWAALLAKAVLNKGFKVKILDANAEKWDAAESARKALSLDPLLVAVPVYGHNPSASTQVMPGASAFCRELKKMSPQTCILMIGGHVSALPEQTVREEAVDFVCPGEGPRTLEALIPLLKSGADDFSPVPDLLFLENGEIRKTAAAPLLQDLDHEMPGMAWELLPMSKYRSHNWHCFGAGSRTPYAAIYTTLGCPYHCQFCCIQAPFRSGEGASGIKANISSYRFWSPEFVVSQIDILVKQYGVRHIKFADEMFVLNKKHVGEICDRLIERGYDLNIWAYARVDTVDEKMIPKLLKAGFRWLAFGVEAAGEEVRADVDKQFSQKQIFETIRKVREGGIFVIANYIFGLPEDTLDSMQATLDLAIELNTEFANFYCTMAYPGSALYQMALKEKWPLPKTWDGYSQHSQNCLPLPTKHLSAAAVLKFRDQAFNLYFDRLAYREMIALKFGASALDELDRMLNARLQRKNY